MKTKRLLKIVWAFNGVALMLLIIIGLALAGIELIKNFFATNTPAVITSLAPDPQGQEKWRLGAMQEVTGDQWLYLPLVSEKKEVAVAAQSVRKGGLAYGEEYFGPSRNLLFINKETRAMRWLFPGNSQIITQIEQVAKGRPYEKDGVSEAIIYQVVDRDSNGDGKLTSDDTVDLAISAPDGMGYKVFAQGVERLFGARVMAAGECLVLYQALGRGYASVVRLSDLTVLETREMPRSEGNSSK